MEAYQSLTRPIWDFLLGWAFEWIGWELPSWVKDYLSMGVIVTFAVIRADASDIDDFVISFLILVIIWPISIFSFSVALARHWSSNDVGYVDELEGEEAKVFFEFLYWTAIILAASHGLIWLGGAAA